MILLAQIETILNSCPLCNVNNTDIDCINILKSSHFFTGDMLLSPHEPLLTSLANIQNNLLQKMQKKKKKKICKAWTKSYLFSLQIRKKWKDA